MNQELQTADFYDEMNTVVTALLKGETNPTALARQLKMPRKRVIEYMGEWRKIASNRPDIRERAMEALTAMDQHYSLIIKEMWEICDETLDMKLKATTLKSIADVEVKRQESLQRAGMFDDSGIADEIASMEEQADLIKNLLSEVARKYPETRAFIMEEIQRIFGQGPTIKTDDDTIIGEVADGS